MSEQEYTVQELLDLVELKNKEISRLMRIIDKTKTILQTGVYSDE